MQRVVQLVGKTNQFNLTTVRHSEQAIRTLERRGLVTEIGRAPGPGQAVLYGTTDVFLEKLGLASIGELPPLADHVPPAQIMETLEMPMRPESSSNDSTS